MHVVLVGIEQEGNLGMIARLCMNFNAGLILVKPAIEVTDEAKRWAMRARKFLEGVEITDDIKEIRGRFDYVVGATAKTASDYNVNRSRLMPWEIERAKNMALVFGRESRGLTNEELALCDAVVHIPTRNAYKSLNISNAVAIILYELNKKKPRKVADRELQDKIHEFWNKLLDELGYKEKKRTQSTLFRRVIGKAHLTDREGHGIAGVLKKASKKRSS